MRERHVVDGMRARTLFGIERHDIMSYAKTLTLIDLQEATEVERVLQHAIYLHKPPIPSFRLFPHPQWRSLIVNRIPICRHRRLLK